MSTRLGLSLVTVAALSLPMLAQTKPNLAGKWEMVYEKSTPVRPAPTPPFPPTTISQDANTITISAVASTPVSGMVMSFNPGANGATPPTTSTSQAAQTQGKREDFAYTLTYVCDGVEHPEPDKVPPLPPAAAPTPAPPAGARLTTMTFTNPTYTATWAGNQLVLATRATTKMDPPSATFRPQQRSTRKTYSIDNDGFLIIESLTTYEPPSNGPAPTPARAVYRKIS